MRKLLRRLRKQYFALLDVVLGRLFAPIVAYMARTGYGTDACMDRKCLPIRVHYYSPLPDLSDLEVRELWQRRTQLEGVDLRIEEQLDLLQRLGRRFGSECKWPHQRAKDPALYHTASLNFSYGCAAITHSMIRYFRPARVVEIGSGNSSKVIAAALQLNHEDDEHSSSRYTAIDPFPLDPISGGLPGLDELIQERVELLDVATFDELAGNDILFVDSGHTVRTGGDVNYLILDVLPRLSEGVLIHFHDIPFPYDYPKSYFTNARFRVFWTEAYLLQAFLAMNRSFQVRLAMGYLMSDHLADFAVSFPNYDPDIHTLSSGSFWMQRVGT